MATKFYGYIWAGLFVADLETEIAFYRDVVGFPYLRQENGFAFFDAGNGDLFELCPAGVASSSPKTPAQQSVKVSFHVDNLDEAIADLESRGVQFLDRGEEDGTHWVTFVDPEGNLLEMKQLADAPSSPPVDYI